MEDILINIYSLFSKLFCIRKLFREKYSELVKLLLDYGKGYKVIRESNDEIVIGLVSEIGISNFTIHDMSGNNPLGELKENTIHIVYTSIGNKLMTNFQRKLTFTHITCIDNPKEVIDAFTKEIHNCIKFNISNMLQTKYFYKEEGRWYIDLPEYIEAGLGDKENLQMVLGADLVLDKLSNNTNQVTLKFSEEMNFKPDVTLVKIQEGKNDEDLKAVGHPMVDTGAYYVPMSVDIDSVWLCPVTKWVFGGKYPKEINILVV